MTAESKNHPLNRLWTLWYDSKKTLKGDDWEASLVHINTVGTAEDFWVMHNHTKRPSSIDVGASYHFFRQGVKPMWEDPANAQGGKFVFTFSSKEDLARLDQVWEDLLLGVVGEYLDDGDEICGLVLGKRKTQTKISVWTANKDVLNVLAHIGSNVRREAKVDPSTAIEYFPHRDSTGTEFPASILKA